MSDVAYADHLLPPNATAAERALATVAGRITALPVAIDTLKRPRETPAAFLPFLAWEDSVDIWDDDWSDEKKRAVTERSLVLHQKKGTIYCLREYVRYAGGEVLRVERPGQRVYSGASMTREERERWLAALPQLRVWSMREPGSAPGWKRFSGGPSRPQFAELTAMTPSAALQHLRRRARYVVDGVETETRVSEFGSAFRLHLRRAHGRGLGVFSNLAHARGFFLPSDAAKHLVTIEPAPAMPSRAPVGPSLTPVTAEPELVKEQRPHTPGLGVISNVAYARGFFLPSTAKFHMYERWAIDNAHRVSRRPPLQVMGLGRYGFPAHTLHVHVSIPRRRLPFAAGEGIALRGTRFWLPHDERPIERVVRAVIASQRGSDRIRLVLGRRRGLIAGQRFIAGGRYVAGQRFVA